MRINDLQNIQKNAGTGINNDLSLIEGADSMKYKTTAPTGENRGAVGFFAKTDINKGASSAVKYQGKDNSTGPVSRLSNSTLTYSMNEAKGLGSQDEKFGQNLLEKIENGQNNNDKELIKNLTGDDYADLNDEGMSLEKFGKERLERAIERIKENREIKDLRLAEGVEKQQEYRETVERMAVMSSADSGSEKLIAKLLYEADIPVTDENIEEIEKAFNASKVQLTDSAESYMIKNGLAPTIDNLYMASHTGEMRLVKIDDASWENLKQNAIKIVNEAGTDTEKGLENAKWLVEHELPVTSENIVFKSELDEIRDIGQWEAEDIYRASIRAMQTGKSAGDGILSVKGFASDAALTKQITDIIDGIPSVSNDAIIKAFSEGATEESITIPDLIKAEEKVQTDGGNNAVNDAVSGELNSKEANTRIRLEEVRVSLNIEASRRLMSKGVNIITDGLMRVTEGIRELQREYFRDLYKEIGLDSEKSGGINAEELGKASELALRTKESLEKIASAPLDLYKATFSVRHTVTLAELGENGEILTKTSVQEASGSISITPSSMKNALVSYEKSSTEIRRDLGDSIKKAFAGSVDTLLNESGLEITEANRRAVRILGYNSMEINAESIENMKFYDAKVTGLVEKMSGPVVMEMIREGVNPLDSTIDELSEKVDSIIKEHGSSRELKYSEFLVNMEASNSVTENERNAYIGIYRLLYNIEKNDGSAIGSLLGSGRELTFRNLMTEARSMDRSVDLSADDETGIKASHYTNSVTAQIDEAFSYQMRLVDKALNVTDAGSWQGALSGKDYGAMTIEGLTEGLDRGDTAADLKTLDIKAAEISGTMMTENYVSDLLNSFGITDSFTNRKTAEDIFQNPDKEGSAVEVSIEELSEALESGSKFDELLGIKTRMANTLTGQAFKTAITAQSAAELNSRVERIEMVKKLSGKGHYRLNVNDDEGESKQINITMIRNTGNSGTVSVEISQKGLELQADLNITMMDARYNAPSINSGNIYVSKIPDEAGMTGTTGNTIHSRISAGQQASFDQTGREFAEQIRTALQNSGINADNINISGIARNGETYASYLAKQREKAGFESENETEADTRSMLSVAKSILSAF